MENSIKSLSDSIGRELISESIDLSEDYAEIGLDMLLENEAFKQVPVVKTIVGLAKGSLAIRELVFARKLAVFLSQFHKGTHKEQDRSELLYKLQADPKKRDRIVEQIIVMNERYVDSSKSVIHANLLIAHLMEKLTWEELSDLLVNLDSLHPKSIRRLSDHAHAAVPFTTDNSIADDANLYASGLASLRFGSYVIVDMGRKLYYYGMKADYDSVIPPSS
jgi:hypothetical protein